MSAQLLLRYLKPYRARLAVLSIGILAATLSEGLGVGLFYPLLDYIQRGEAFMTQGAAKPLFDRLAAAGFAPSVGLFIALIFLVIVLTLILKFAVFLGSAWIYHPLMKDLRDEAFKKIIHSHLFNFYSGSSAALSQTLENEVEYVGQAFNFSVLIAASVLSLMVYTGFILFVSWKLTLLVVAIGAARYAVSGMFLRRTRRLGEEHGVLHTALKSRLTAIYQGIDVVKSFGTEKREEDNFKALTRRICGNANAIAATTAGNSFVEGILGDGLLCVLVYLAVSRLSVSGAALLTFLFVITRIIPKVTAVNDARIRIAEYLSRVSLLPKALSADGLSVLSWGQVAKPGFNDRIVFEGVSFAYPGAGAPSLEKINLNLIKDETLAIVGESGAGKSTLARLLLRLFDPTAGRIFVDGVALSDIRREDWTRLVSVVSQDTFIFDDTLENNVKYGAVACTPAQFRKALERARADEFVNTLPEKEKTQLGERGVKLSGGQRQRIAIARAFLRDSPILILDEATSAMDALTEKLIQDAILELAKNRTMVVIAHRFTTIRNAHRIVVLEKGRIAETGSHQELLDTGLLYRKYHDLQVR